MTGRSYEYMCSWHSLWHTPHDSCMIQKDSYLSISPVGHGWIRVTNTDCLKYSCKWTGLPFLPGESPSLVWWQLGELASYEQWRGAQSAMVMVGGQSSHSYPTHPPLGPLLLGFAPSMVAMGNSGLYGYISWSYMNYVCLYFRSYTLCLCILCVVSM